MEIFSFTLVNWPLYESVFLENLDYNPVSILDNSKIDKSHFLSLQGTIGGTNFFKNIEKYDYKYRHSSISLLHETDTVVHLPDLQILTFPNIVIYTGDLLQWRDLLIIGSDNKAQNRILSLIYDTFERNNIPLWQDYEKLQTKMFQLRKK